MKASHELIAMLNTRLAEEHAAVAQYVTHAGMCENWGFKRLAAYIKDRAKQEMKHAGMLLDRILFLEGYPDLSTISPVFVGNSVIEMFPLDNAAEVSAIAGYVEGIELSMKEKDVGTMCMLQCILQDEEAHLGSIEQNIAQITQIGIDGYLSEQIKE